MNIDPYLLDFLLQDGPVAVFSWQLDWTLIYVSKSIERILGLSRAEVYSTQPVRLERIHPEDWALVADALNQIRTSESATFCIRILCKPDTYSYVQTTLRLVRNALGEPLQIVGLVMDVTKDQELTRSLRRQKQQLEDANKSLEEFVYIASHDLREPLTGIAGYADLVRKRYLDKLDDRGQHFLNSIVEQAKRLEAKIDDLLQLSRAGRGKPNGMFPLGAAIEEARRSLASRLRDTGAVLELVDPIPMVRGNRGEIAQVFQNLFSNSLKYQKPDSIPRIRIHVETTSLGWEIFVTDDGIGFEMEHAERIFGVFQRLYTVDQYPGTGIGLAIVKKIIDKHGGRVRAQSAPNQGATFSFTLPKEGPQRPERP